jgi:hypothetical protein
MGSEPVDEGDEAPEDAAGGDCERPHLWIEVVGLKGEQAVCRAAYGQGTNAPVDASVRAKANALEDRALLPGRLDHDGQCSSYFEAARDT